MLITSRIPNPKTLLPWVLGVGAAIASVVLLHTTMVWMALVIAGIVVVVVSFISRDLKLYWLAVFLTTIPLNITKLLFFSPEDVARMKEHYGVIAFENLVPQLYLSDLPLLVLLALWVGEILVKRKRIYAPKAMLVAAGFIAWCLLTLTVASAPELGLVWIFYQVKNLLMFLWFVNAALDRRAIRLVVAVLLAGLALQGLMTVYSYRNQIGEHFWGDTFGVGQTSREIRTGAARGTGAAYVYESGDLLRGSGSVGVGNLQAMYFVMVLPLALAWGLFARRGLVRLVSLAVFGVGMVGLVLTYSRGGLLTTFIALVALLVLTAHRGLIGRKTFASIGVLSLVGLSALTPFLYDYFSSRPTFLMTRFDHSSYGLQIMLQHPMLGVGMNNFNIAINPQDYGGVFAAMPLHNHYLRVGIETGLIGLAIYLAFFAWTAGQAYRSIWITDRLLASTAIALFASLIGISAYWMTDLFYDAVVRTQLWVTIALIVVIRQIGKKEPVPGTDILDQTHVAAPKVLH